MHSNFDNFFIEMNCVLNNKTVVGCLLRKDCFIVAITPVSWLLFGIHIYYFRLWQHNIVWGNTKYFWQFL